MNELEGEECHKTTDKRVISGLTQADDKCRLTVVITEAGRIADRLEKLDATVSGEQREWTRLCDDRAGD
jgi:hypothetical protein